MILDLNKGKILEPDRMSERSLQEYVYTNLTKLFGVIPVAKEFPIDMYGRSGRIDVLGVDTDGRLVVFELKADKSRTVLNQAAEYCAHLLSNIHAVSAITNTMHIPIKNVSPRIVCIASAYSPSDFILRQSLNVDIELYTYALYAGSLLAIERAEANQECRSVKSPIPSGISGSVHDVLVDFFMYVNRNGSSMSKNVLFMKHNPLAPESGGFYGNTHKKTACIYGQLLFLIKMESIVALMNEVHGYKRHNKHTIKADVDTMFSISLRDPKSKNNIVLAPRQYKHKIHGMFTAFNYSLMEMWYPSFFNMNVIDR